MPAIAPNTTVKLLQGVHIDSDYNHTIFFPDVNAQTTFMQSCVAVNYGTYSNQMYQRVGDGKIRLQVLADNIYGCNYMMFQNTNYGTKWFYAFINKIRYVNDNATEIEYTIDDMQTWYFDYELGSSFVEREHTETDNYGEHRVSEPFPNLPALVDTETVVKFGKLVTSGATADPEVPYSAIILYVPNTRYDNGHQYAKIVKSRVALPQFPGQPPFPVSFINDPLYPEYHDYVNNGSTYIYQYWVEDVENGASLIANKLYAGYNYLRIPVAFRDVTIHYENQTTHTISLTDASRININRAIESLTEAQANIVDMYQVPDKIVPYTTVSGVRVSNFEDALTGTTGTGTTALKTSVYINLEFKSFSVKNDNDTAATVTKKYTPKNNKLYTYPYKYLIISNHNGETKTIRWEDFAIKGGAPSGSTIKRPLATFYAQSAALPKPIISLVPYTYRGVTYDFGNSVNLTDFFKTSWSTDSYAEWKAQNTSSIATSTIAHALGIIAGAAVLPASPAVAVGAAVGLASSAASVISQGLKATNAPDQLSGSQTSTLDLVRDYFGFSIYQMGINADYAETIDNYFSMYGYAINKLKIPNIKSDFAIQNGYLRAHWNYIKTNGCVIHGKISSPTNGLPADAEKNIASIYDRGITFWMNGSEVGHYSLDNNEHYIPE